MGLPGEQTLLDFLSIQLEDSETQWSVGTFGALAEFSRELSETVDIAKSDAELSAVTNRGGIRVRCLSEIQPVASESTTRESWNHRVALCLHESQCAMSQRNVLTCLGRDNEALRESDREAVLFDLGLGALQVDACIRVSDRALVSELQSLTGRNVFEANNPTMGIVVPHSPHRIFVSRLGRLEVFQPIPPPNGRSPEGPHTHVLPKLLQSRRTHASTEPIPGGLVPCAHLYPAHPAKDDLGRALPFDERRHVSFQNALQRFGNQDMVDLKQRVIKAIEDGAGPSAVTVPNDRHARGTVRVTLRQLRVSSPSLPALVAWFDAYDPSHGSTVDVDESDSIHAHS